jgi:hypothetical protein
MQVKVEPAGTIQKHFPGKIMFFTLRKDARLSDLYDEIGNSIGSSLPKSIWNHEKSRFRGPVIVASDNTVLKEEETLLRHNQLITLKRLLVGG